MLWYAVTSNWPLAHLFEVVTGLVMHPAATSKSSLLGADTITL